MAAVYSEYSRDRAGIFFGLTGGQLATLVVAAGPALWAFQNEEWALVAGFALGWGIVLALVAIPIRGRSATGWMLASLAHAAGTVLRWTRWRSKAATGRVDELGEPDLPGVLAGITVQDRRKGRRTPGSRSSRTMPTGYGPSPPRSPIPVWRWPTRPKETAKGAA